MGRIWSNGHRITIIYKHTYLCMHTENVIGIHFKLFSFGEHFLRHYTWLRRHVFDSLIDVACWCLEHIRSHFHALESFWLLFWVIITKIPRHLNQLKRVIMFQISISCDDKTENHDDINSFYAMMTSVQHEWHCGSAQNSGR